MPNLTARNKKSRGKSEKDLNRIIKADLHKISKKEAEENIKQNPPNIRKSIYDVFFHTGTQTLEILTKIKAYTLLAASAVFGKFVSVNARFLRRFSIFFLLRQKEIAEPFILIFKGISILKKNVLAQRKNGIIRMAKAFAETASGGVRRNSFVIKGFFNHATPIAAVITLIMLAGYYSNINFALEIGYNGFHVGYIENETVYDNAGNLIQSGITRASADDPHAGDITEYNTRQIIDKPADLSVAIADPEDLIDDKQLYNEMLKMSSNDISESFGLFVDGKFYGAVNEHTNVDAFLDEFIANYQKKYKDSTVSLLNEIEFEYGLYKVSDLKTEEQLIEVLDSQVSERVTYNVINGDTPSGIAKKHNVPYSQIKALNPNIEKRLMPGDEILIAEAVPFLNIKVVKQIEYNEVIPFETKRTSDSSKLIGINTVIREGVDGKVVVYADVEYVDGVETKKTVTGKTIISDPITEEISIGIKAPVSVYIAPGGEMIGGSLIWPVGGGYLSQAFKGAAHNGLDIAAPAGTPVYAAADGVVTVARSGFDSGYGKCIIVDHGNGFKTLYAHNSELYVKPGEKVQQGQVIAAVGNTGNSRGNHLHFNVIQDGVTYNPMDYIK